MPLTKEQIESAKPGLRPLKQNGEDEQPSSEARKEPNRKAKPVATDHEQKFVRTDKPYKLSDGGGLYLEVDPSGGKYWRFKYRFPNPA
ncbi:MAG: Arm DNA-binding domain-containing protein [Terracidiphilus sp.]